MALKYPGVTAIPARKALPPRPVYPRLNTWRQDPHLLHTCAAAVAQLVIQEHLNHIYHSVTGHRKNYGKLKLLHTKRCTISMYNELGRLASGVRDRIKSGTETVFIWKNQVPAGRNATYSNAVCDYRPLKDEPCHVRLTVEGDRLIYPGDTRAPAASLLDSKPIFNITISTPGDPFLHRHKILFSK